VIAAVIVLAVGIPTASIALGSLSFLGQARAASHGRLGEMLSTGRIQFVLTP